MQQTAERAVVPQDAAPLTPISVGAAPVEGLTATQVAAPALPAAAHLVSPARLFPSMPTFSPDETTPDAPKIYVVTRADLSPGYQLTQACHALADLLLSDPAAARAWHTTSSSLITLVAADEPALFALAARAEASGLGYLAFREPDLADEVTALAFTPDPGVRRLLANLPLAGKPVDPAVVRAAQARERSLRDLVTAMEGCEQTRGLNVLDHGRMVRDRAVALVEHLTGVRDLADDPQWRLPSWLLDEPSRQLLAALVVDRWTMERYTVLHDAGKPACRTVDAGGKVHFPDHAEVSARTVAALGLSADVVELVRRDMQAHTMKAVDVPAFVGTTVDEARLATTLLVVGVAEVHANASMFGGVTSDGFKSKLRQLERRGRAALPLLAERVMPLA